MREELLDNQEHDFKTKDKKEWVFLLWQLYTDTQKNKVLRIKLKQVPLQEAE